MILSLPLGLDFRDALLRAPSTNQVARRSHLSVAKPMALSVITAVVRSTRHERDDAFRSEMAELVARRSIAIGILGLSVLALYMAARILVQGKIPTWSYDSVSGPGRIGLFDKAAIGIVSASLLTLRLRRTPLQPVVGRLLLTLASMVAVVAMTLDDVASGTVVFSQEYVTLVIMVLLGVVPFPPPHGLIASSLIILSWYLSLVWGPAFLGVETAFIGFGQTIFLAIVWVLAGGISLTLYSSRFREFRVRQELLGAEQDLRRHAEELERTAIELAEAKKKAEQRAEQLEELKAVRSRFFSGISHEFRTPLTLILGPATDALREDENTIPPEVAEGLELIKRSGSRLLDLVDQLLELSRLETGKLPLRVRRYDVGVFCQSVTSFFESLAKHRRIQLTLGFDCSDAELYFDAEQMQKVLTNLLSNAFKFTPDAGAIRVRVSDYSTDGSDWVDISVKDNGQGIPAEDLAMVFDRFYQVERESVPSHSGSGIGLALAKELVELHGGQLTVTSEEGFGSEFTVRLPKGSAHFDPNELAVDVAPLSPPRTQTAISILESDLATADLDSDEGRHDRPTVLAVDDHPDMRRYMFSLLKDRYRVILANDGAEGLAFARKVLPDLIISDLMMPELDGLSFCSAVKEDKKTAHIPFVLLTARESHDARLQGFGAGADDYIIKPFDAEELIARAENLIEIRRALRGFPRGGSVSIEPSWVDEPSADQRFLESVRVVVEAHMGDSNFSVDWLADEVGMSRRQLERRLNQTDGLSPAGYIRLMRLKRAAQLLDAKFGTIAEVAYKVGFNDPNYLSRLFKQTFGVTPTEYLRGADG